MKQRTDQKVDINSQYLKLRNAVKNKQIYRGGILCIILGIFTTIMSTYEKSFRIQEIDYTEFIVIILRTIIAIVLMAIVKFLDDTKLQSMINIIVALLGILATGLHLQNLLGYIEQLRTHPGEDYWILMIFYVGQMMSEQRIFIIYFQESFFVRTLYAVIIQGIHIWYFYNFLNWKVETFQFVGFIIQILLNSFWSEEDNILVNFLMQLEVKFSDEKNWKKLVDGLSEGIIIFNRHSQIQYKNSPCNKLFGLQNGEAISEENSENKQEQPQTANLIQHQEQDQEEEQEQDHEQEEGKDQDEIQQEHHSPKKLIKRKQRHQPKPQRRYKYVQEQVQNEEKLLKQDLDVEQAQEQDQKQDVTQEKEQEPEEEEKDQDQKQDFQQQHQQEDLEEAKEQDQEQASEQDQEEEEEEEEQCLQPEIKKSLSQKLAVEVIEQEKEPPELILPRKEESFQIQSERLYVSKSNGLNEGLMVLMDSNDKQKFPSLESYLQWIMDSLKLNWEVLPPRHKRAIYNIETKIKDKDYKEQNLDMIVEMTSFANEVVSSIIVRNQMYKQLKTQILQEKNMQKLRQLMVGSISHDLRTPLNSIMSLLDVAIQDKKKSQQEIIDGYLQPSLSSCHLMLTLVNDILDFTKHDFNKDPRMSYSQTDIKQEILEVKLMLVIQTKIRKIGFVCEIDEEIPKSFMTDARRLKQILINLTANAIKFTYEGSVKIVARCKMIGDQKAVEISVIDSGLGIKKEDQKKLFKLFSIIDSSSRANQSGTGFGLYQSNIYARKLGFEGNKGITIDSQLDKGSTFIFILQNKEPLMRIGENDIPQDEVAYSMKQRMSTYKFDVAEKDFFQGLQNQFSEEQEMKIEIDKSIKEEVCCPKILIVDDNGFNLISLRAVLTSIGYECDQTHSGINALEMVIEQSNKSCNCKYQLILLDCNMPQMDGFTVCVKLRKMIQDEEIPQLCIVAVTADATEQNREKCEETGFDAFLTKPVKKEALRQILTEQITNKVGDSES